MGTPDFALPSFAALAEAGHEIACVYSQPPRPAGRGHKERLSPVQRLAESRGWPLRTPASLKNPEARADFADLALDAAVVMDVLGIEVVLNWADKLVSTCVAEAKAVKWTEALLRLCEEHRLSPDEASRMAGRLSFAVTAFSNKVGRAFVKPFYAQAHSPMRGWRCSPGLLNAALWWLQLLGLRVRATHSTCLARPHTPCYPR